MGTSKKKNFARCFGQDIIKGEWGGGVNKRAIPGGGTGKNSAFIFRTTEGYDTGAAAQAEGSGTSIFDPVLCELVYRWFSPPGGLVLDPFSGGSVRGIVASKLGRQYVGNDLRREQVEENRRQADRICADPMPVWHCGDSKDLDTIAAGVQADLVFSCPPYADLEVYSDDPRDISNMSYEAFRSIYGEIIRKSCALLKDDRFACFVVGEVRGPKGGYYGFVPATIAAFLDAGCSFYNEAILVTAVGSLPIRAGRAFSAGRKLGKTHQNVLVFVKGDPKRATEACGAVVVDESAFASAVSAGQEV